MHGNAKSQDELRAAVRNGVGRIVLDSCSEVTDLAGDEAGRVRLWDSCYAVDHSYIHGGSIRPSGRSRYRQWLTHKFGTWHDQFGTSGCIGCGRCITWCPVGIDVTVELAAIRATEEVSDAND